MIIKQYAGNTDSHNNGQVNKHMYLTCAYNSTRDTIIAHEKLQHQKINSLTPGRCGS